MGGDSEGTNPKRYKITFLVIAIVAASVAVTYYPEPKPLIPTPLPDNRIIIRMTIISENLDKFRQIYPATGTIVSFHKIVNDGQPSDQSVKTRADSDGIARISLYEGTYLVRISDWEPITVRVTNDTSIFVRHYEIQERPASVKILSLSKDWKIVSKDIMILTYSNRFPHPIFVESASFSGKEAINTICKLQQNKLSGNEMRCLTPIAVMPNHEWIDSFEVPNGVSIPFYAAKELNTFSLQISYTEVRVDSQPP